MAGPIVKPINKRLGTNYDNQEELLEDLELPVAFAKIEQWRRNLQRAELSDALLGLPSGSVRVQPGKRGLMSRLKLKSQEGKPITDEDIRAHVKEWRSYVPKWAEPAKDKLKAMGIPYMDLGVFELLKDPEINLDGTAPLYEKGAIPVSLAPIHGNDADSEGAVLQQATAAEIMLEVWPHQWRYNHRPAGAKVPTMVWYGDGKAYGYAAGLTFGSPVLMPNGVYVWSPIMSTEIYRRWRRNNPNA